MNMFLTPKDIGSKIDNDIKTCEKQIQKVYDNIVTQLNNSIATSLEEPIKLKGIREVFYYGIPSDYIYLITNGIIEDRFINPLINNFIKAGWQHSYYDSYEDTIYLRTEDIPF